MTTDLLQKQTFSVAASTDFMMPGTVRFGVNSFLSLGDELEKLGVTKVAVISDKGLEKVGLVDRAVEVVHANGKPSTTFTEIAGEPTFDLLAESIAHVKAEGCDAIVGIGGGSALDVAKATAALLDKDDLSSYFSGEKTVLQRTVSCILLPTTSGTGAEVTKNAIFEDTENEVKRGLVSASFLPDVAIIDPALTLSCPSRVTAASGVDAFTHAIESYVAVNATPITKMYAEKAMRLFAPNIASAVHNGKDLEGRIGMSWVSVLAGVSLANAGVGAVHALAYPLGGKYHIEHGVANALLMPFVFEVTGETRMSEMVNVASFLQLGDYSNNPHEALEAVVSYLYQLLGKLNLPTSLSELGISKEDLPDLAHQASKIDRLLSNTPYKLSEEMILSIYLNAYKGVKQRD